MAAYIYIIASLLLYPVIGRFLVNKTNPFPQIQKKIVVILCIISLLVILSILADIITISQNLNWFLVTSIYFTVSVLFWSITTGKKAIYTNAWNLLKSATFTIGYIVATFGFFFVVLASFDLETDQRKWLTSELIYKERNIGQGPDPSVRLKKIAVYKRINLFPILAYGITAKTYDEWQLPLQKRLDVTFSHKDQTLLLESVVKGYKTFNFSDTISLAVR